MGLLKSEKKLKKHKRERNSSGPVVVRLKVIKLFKCPDSKVQDSFTGKKT